MNSAGRTSFPVYVMGGFLESPLPAASRLHMFPDSLKNFPFEELSSPKRNLSHAH
jgi:hypothetical protein